MMGRRKFQMGSMRDVNRVMEREIAKGSCPLKLDHIEFGEYSYREIASEEKLLEVLSYLLRIGDFSQYAGKTVINNVYMDLHRKKPIFKRTKTAIERNNIFSTIKKYAKKLKPEYNGEVYLETVRCCFDISQEILEKCQYTYNGNETYAFVMSDKYIIALYAHCLVKRKEVEDADVVVEGFTSVEYGIMKLTSIKNVLFQAFVLDDIQMEGGKIYVNWYNIYKLQIFNNT